MRRPQAYYSNPIGGTSRLVSPGLAIHSCPFTLGKLAFGARCTSVLLSGPDKPVAVISPTPYGEETEKMLQQLVQDSNHRSYNVKYLVLTDIVHHMGAGSWKEKYPDVKIIGVKGLCSKKQQEGIKIDYVFDEEHANKLVTSPLENLDLPQELTDVISFMYLPGHHNQELIVYHGSSKTLIESDLLMNFPAYEQYKGSSVSPVGGFSNILRFMGPSSWIGKKLMSNLFDSHQWKSSQTALQSVWELGIDRIIPSHGDVLEGEAASETFAQVFGLSKEAGTK